VSKRCLCQITAERVGKDDHLDVKPFWPPYGHAVKSSHKAGVKFSQRSGGRALASSFGEDGEPTREALLHHDIDE
jgi:hypothetical protein